jgi:D-glycero-alpha-D-manno-heptose-7-phosphate kinase
MIISRTPFRISFFGGGTDYPEWYGEHGGAVLATTIDKYCYISVRELPPFFDHRFRVVYSIVENVKEIGDIQHPAVRGVLESLKACRAEAEREGWAGKGLEIHHDGDLPARSGLGSSSAFTVGLINAVHALDGRHMAKETLANEAIHVEQCVLRERVGLQDQVSAAFGGFNHISIAQNGTYSVTPIVLPPDRLQALQSHLMLVFTGISRTANEVAETVVTNMKNKASDMRTMQQMVDQAIDIVSSAKTDLVEFGKLLRQAWQLKRALSDRVTNATVDDLIDSAMRAGAIGGKLLGAGGGGFMLLFVRPENQTTVRAALSNLIAVPFKFDMSGSRIVLYQPNGL